MNEEHRARNILYQQMMRVPHRNYGPMSDAFNSAIEDDPDFSSRAMVHLFFNSQIRDQQDCAVIALMQSSPEQCRFRDAGRVLLLGSDVYETRPKDLPGLPPFRILRVWDYLRNSNRKVPRLAKNIILDWFGMLEGNHARADGVMAFASNRKMTKSAWKQYHLRPEDFPYLHSLLFSKEPPEGSKAAAIRQISETENPREWMRLAEEHKLPYKTLSSILPDTPAAKLVLVSAMTPTEALNSRAWVEQSGILGIPEAKEAYLAKVEQATASVSSIQHRQSAKGSDTDIEAATQKAAQKATETGQRIERATLILVDKSSSMERAFPVAQEIGSRMAPITDGDLMVVLFNDYAQVLEVEDRHSLQGWQNAFRNQRASGWTSMQAGFDTALRAGFMPEQIIVVSDHGENRGSLSQSLANFSREQGYVPHIVDVYTPSGHGDNRFFVSSLQQAGANVDEFTVDGSDYYVYDQIVAAAGGPPALTLVQAIMETQLPELIR